MKNAQKEVKKEFQILEFGDKKLSYDANALKDSILAYASHHKLPLVKLDTLAENPLQHKIRSVNNELSYNLLKSISEGIKLHLPTIKANERLEILQGHQRIKALELLGIAEYPVEVIKTNAQSEKLLLLDNIQDSRENAQNPSTFEQLNLALYLTEKCKNTINCRKELKICGFPRTSADRLGNLCKFPKQILDTIQKECSFSYLLNLYNLNLKECKAIHGESADIDMLKPEQFKTLVIDDTDKKNIVTKKTLSDFNNLDSIPNEYKTAVNDILTASQPSDIIKASDSLLLQSHKMAISNKSEIYLNMYISDLNKKLKEATEALKELQKTKTE